MEKKRVIQKGLNAYQNIQVIFLRNNYDSKNYTFLNARFFHNFILQPLIKNINHF